MTEEEESPWDLYYGLWPNTDDGIFIPMSALDYVYKIAGGSAPRKHVVPYDDRNITILAFCGKNDRPVGYGIHLKANLSLVHQQHSLIMTDPTSTQHHSAEYIIDGTDFKCLRAATDGGLGFSYWASARRKDTVL